MNETGQNRLISLDVFRGMTIAGMVLVNNPGTSPVYWPLDHAEWNGLTPTDWIFPFFLFIVGVAIPIALGKRIEEGVTRKVYTKIVSRAALIYGLGLVMSIIPFFQFQSTDASDPLKMTVWLFFTGALFFALLRNFKIAGILAIVGVAGIVVMNLAGYNVVPYNFGTMPHSWRSAADRDLLSRCFVDLSAHNVEAAASDRRCASFRILATHDGDTGAWMRCNYDRR